jgi:hypothetical protein
VIKQKDGQLIFKYPEIVWVAWFWVLVSSGASRRKNIDGVF